MKNIPLIQVHKLNHHKLLLWYLNNLTQITNYLQLSIHNIYLYKYNAVKIYPGTPFLRLGNCNLWRKRVYTHILVFVLTKFKNEDGKYILHFARFTGIKKTHKIPKVVVKSFIKTCNDYIIPICYCISHKF